jgi:predicted glycogen debranching enzyme
MKFPEILVESGTVKDIDKSKNLEWITTNGTGGYASSTITGMNSRKYHGLLIATKNPPQDRKLVLSKLEEEVVFKKERFSLSTNQYLGTIYPKGYENQLEFKLDPFPTFIYKVRNVEIKKTVFMVQKKNISIVRYEVKNPKKFFFKIKISPFVNYRSIFDLKKKNEEFKLDPKENKVTIWFNKDDYLRIRGQKFKVSKLGKDERWYKNFHHRKDNERGEDSIENNYCPGHFEFEIRGKKEVFFVVSSFCQDIPKHPNKLVNNEIKYKEKVLKVFHGKSKFPKDDWIKWIVLALDSHLVNGNSVIAGYHWFGEWGRDTLISIPGLLKLGKENEVKDILRHYGKHSRNGIIPNMLSRGKGEETIFNTVDASLWFIDRVYRTYKKTDDKAFMREMIPVMKYIVSNYIKGTDFDIKMDGDNLVNHGPGLTWMDAKVNGKYITPRTGKAVEIQGLWFNALMILHTVTKEEKYLVIAEKTKASFNEKFWNGEYLDDVYGDSSLRPNQLIVLELPFCIVDEDRKKKIISVIEKELLTTSGLLTLSRSDPRYKGRYEGYIENRDAAYHQGTIWPWLIGTYIRVTGNKEFLRLFVEKELNQFGLGTIGEIFDGDQPHIPRGCISQAWSLAEILASI